MSCGERFTTVEMPQLSTIQIVKKDGRREPFERQKLLAGLRRATSKRAISTAELEDIVSEIEAKVISDGRAEVPSSVVGELAMDHLRALDHIAYIRFASVYKSFADLDTLKDALAALEQGRIPTAEERSLHLPLLAEQGEPPRSIQEFARRDAITAESAG